MKPFYLLLLISSFFFVSCSSKLTIQSQPPDAQVFIAVQGKKDKTSAGKTPLEFTEAQLQTLLNISAQTSEWLQVTFEKKDFNTQTIFIPSNRWGELQKIVKVELEPTQDSSTVVQKIIRYLFNAKKFAETRQYDQAHQELDKTLQLDSNMAQAMAMKGGVYFLQGNYIESEVWYKKAITLDPSMSEAVQMLEKIKTSKDGG